MNIVEIMQTTSDNGLTLSEIKAKRRMNIAIKAFGKWQKKPINPVIDRNEPKITNLNDDFFNLFT